jgi:hypothetical protein
VSDASVQGLIQLLPPDDRPSVGNYVCLLLVRMTYNAAAAAEQRSARADDQTDVDSESAASGNERKLYDRQWTLPRSDRENSGPGMSTQEIIQRLLDATNRNGRAPTIFSDDDLESLANLGAPDIHERPSSACCNSPVVYQYVRRYPPPPLDPTILKYVREIFQDHKVSENRQFRDAFVEMRKCPHWRYIFRTWAPLIPGAGEVVLFLEKLIDSTAELYEESHQHNQSETDLES